MNPETEPVLEIKYRIIFLPDDDYELFKTMLGDNIRRYDYLQEKAIENIMTAVGTAIYVPDKHRPFLVGQAKKGGPL